MATIFTKIIHGDIPSHAVYEDDCAYAFLDINPRQPGHTLVVPKAEVDDLFDLERDAYRGLWEAARTVAKALKQTTGCVRVVIVVLGYEVPHAHIHLIPSNDIGDLPFPPVVEQSTDELIGMAMAIRDTLTGSRYDESTALVVVDVQNDFAHPDGSLYVAGGEDLVPTINREIEAARRRGATVIYTQDWHPEATAHFVTGGGVWPVHCVRDTWGSAFHPDLDVHEGAPIIQKGTTGEDGYSGFSMADPADPGAEPRSTGLDATLRDLGIRRVVITGLATDYCVKETALDGRRLGFDITVLRDCIGAVDLEPGDGDRAITAMVSAGVEIA